MNDFPDHFSQQAKNYSKYRPQYPLELFSYLAGLASNHDFAWDCATGNGQAALGLSTYFNEVIATDASEAQIKNATPHKNINYIVAPAEKTNIAPASIDLISIAQALHWFDFDHFYPEVRRVIKNDGVIAAWTYKLARVTPEIDKIIDKFHHEIIAEYWPPERTYVDNHYQNIPFPFQRISTPDFQINANWSLERFLNYLKTWSAVVYYEEKNSVNPLSLIEDDLLERWGSFNKSRNIHWPLTMLVSKIDT